MTTMTVIDVVNIDYPGQLEAWNIVFGQDDVGSIFITKWDVPDIDKPTIQQLINRIPILQNEFDLNYFKTVGQQKLQLFLDSVAQQRQYSTAISCASYFNSSHSDWKLESEAFIEWRDNVFIYTLAQIILMDSGQRSVPSFEEFQDELPQISWP
jgi:hypothetical protein